ncbi:MAG: aquaporin Z [Acidobacteriota bacterium]
MPLTRRLSAEFLGTLWLVLGGCGSAVLAATFPSTGIGFAGVALAFGLTVLTGAYALGHISGGHFNPAVSIGLWAGRRFPASELPHYIISQVLGAIAGAGILYIIASDKLGFKIGGFASNGYGDHSPGGYQILGCFVAEVVLTFFFLIVILGTTHKLAPGKFAPIAIGLCLTLIHLISIPVTNTSVNPARSTGPAIFSSIFSAPRDTWPLSQLWLFWLAPILGALAAGFFYSWLVGDDDELAANEVVVVEETILEVPES